MELLVLGLVATLGVASWALWSRARAARLEAPDHRPPELPPTERNASSVVPGDIVQHLGSDWLVEGVLAISEEQRGARLARLVDGAREGFLFSAPADPDPALLEPATAAPGEYAGQPDALVLGGQTYLLKLRSNGTAQRLGVFKGAARKSGDRLSFAFYSAGAQRVLLVAWGDQNDAFTGERVAAHLLEYLPGK
jgi:hypothetical protein